MAQTLLYGTLIQSGSIPATALGGGVISSSAQVQASLPANILSSSAQINTLTGVSASFASTASNLVGGTANYIPLWTSTGAQSSSTMYQLSGNIGINNTVPSSSLHVSGAIMLQQVYEKANITASAPPATFTLDITSGSIFYRSASTAANWTLNVRGDVNTPLNNIMYPGQVLTTTVLVVQGATPYSASAIQIDGVAITPKWQGGTSSSNANSTEATTYTIIKLASASYNVLAAVTKYV